MQDGNEYENENDHWHSTSEPHMSFSHVVLDSVSAIASASNEYHVDSPTQDYQQSTWPPAGVDSSTIYSLAPPEYSGSFNTTNVFAHSSGTLFDGTNITIGTSANYDHQDAADYNERYDGMNMTKEEYHADWADKEKHSSRQLGMELKKKDNEDRQVTISRQWGIVKRYRSKHGLPPTVKNSLLPEVLSLHEEAQRREREVREAMAFDDTGGRRGRRAVWR